jgi:HEAT repeat protein
MVWFWEYLDQAQQGSPADADLVGTAGGFSEIDDGGRAAEGSAPLMEATTPEEVRQVKHYARDATSEDIASLTHMAARSGDPLVAGNAIRALGRLNAFADNPELVALIDDSRLRVRQETVVALGLSGNAEMVDRLLPVLEERENGLRHLAIQALGRLGGPIARQKLEEILHDSDATEADRTFARVALDQVDDSRRVPVRPGGGELK